MPIANAEAHVLQLLWQRPPRTMQEMHAVLSESRVAPWHRDFAHIAPDAEKRRVG
jgi:predicted transcriptional regulator